MEQRYISKKQSHQWQLVRPFLSFYENKAQSTVAMQQIQCRFKNLIGQKIPKPSYILHDLECP